MAYFSYRQYYPKLTHEASERPFPPRLTRGGDGVIHDEEGLEGHVNIPPNGPILPSATSRQQSHVNQGSERRSPLRGRPLIQERYSDYHYNGSSDVMLAAELGDGRKPRREISDDNERLVDSAELRTIYPPHTQPENSPAP